MSRPEGFTECCRAVSALIPSTVTSNRNLSLRPARVSGSHVYNASRTLRSLRPADATTASSRCVSTERLRGREIINLAVCRDHESEMAPSGLPSERMGEEGTIAQVSSPRPSSGSLLTPHLLPFLAPPRAMCARQSGRMMGKGMGCGGGARGRERGKELGGRWSSPRLLLRIRSISYFSALW